MRWSVYLWLKKNKRQKYPLHGTSINYQKLEPIRKGKRHVDAYLNKVP